SLQAFSKIETCFSRGPSPSGRGCREAAVEGRRSTLIRPFGPPSPKGRRTRGLRFPFVALIRDIKSFLPESIRSSRIDGNYLLQIRNARRNSTIQCVTKEDSHHDEHIDRVDTLTSSPGRSGCAGRRCPSG